MSEVELIQLRHGTAAQWTADNPVLSSGELGIETDTHSGKAGDGTTPWNSLPYLSGATSSLQTQMTALQATVATVAIAPVASVKTSAYTAGPGQLVPCDATSGAFTVTLPTAPADASLIEVKKIDSSTNAVTVASGASDVFEASGGVVTLPLTMQNQAVRLQYYAAGRIWYVVANDAPVAGLDARYLSSPTITTPTLVGPVAGSNAIPLTLLQSAAYNTAPTATTLAEWDANKNLSANAFLQGFTTTATAGASTTLTVASTPIQVFTGSLNQTVLLPTTSVPAGAQYTIINASTGAITVQSSGGNTIFILAAGTVGTFTALAATPTTATNWNCRYIGSKVATGKGLTVSNSLTLAGTDGTTLTFPNANDTVVTQAAAQPLTNKDLSGAGMTWPTNLSAWNARAVPAGTVVGTSDAQTLTNKTLTTPTITSPVIGGTGIPNAAIQQAGINNFNVTQQSVVVVSGTPYYITSSGLLMPAAPLNGMVANRTTFCWTVAMNKTAAGTGTFQIVIYRGTTATTTDTADVTQTIGTQTAVVDSMLLQVQLTIVTTGATGSYYWSINPTHDAATATGFGVAVGPTGQFSGSVTGVALNTASLIFGLGFIATTGTPTIVIPQVQAFAYNMD